MITGLNVYVYMIAFCVLRPGLFGNEVGRVLGGGLAPGWLVSVFTM